MPLEAINRIGVGAVIVEGRRAETLNRRAVAMMNLRRMGTRKAIGEVLWTTKLQARRNMMARNGTQAKSAWRTPGPTTRRSIPDRRERLSSIEN